MLEQELKLSVDDGFEMPDLRSPRTRVAEVEELPSQNLRATYYDTPDLRLARNGITLRHRAGEEDSGWGLKLPVGGDGVLSREELMFEGSSRTIPRGARELVTAFARTAPLEPVARLRTDRSRRRLRDAGGEELAELTDDRVSVFEDRRISDRFREIEIEARSANGKGLRRIAALLEKSGAEPERTAKAIRALGPAAAAPPDVPEPDGAPSPSDPASAAVKDAITHGVRRLLINDPGARLGAVEAVHQMRVGTRRLRSDLRTFSPFLDQDWTSGLTDELRWLGRALGRLRDVDVMQARLHETWDGPGDEIGPLFELLDKEHQRARADLLDALRSDRYVSLLDRLVTAVRHPALTAAADEPAAESLPPLAAKAWERLATEARALEPDAPNERFHRVRIRTKRARYAIEAIAPAIGRKQGKRARKLARRLARVQDGLGVLQDTVVLRERIEETARSRPDDGAFNLAAGRLIAIEDEIAAAARERMPKRWRKLDRPERVAWLPL